MQRRASVRRGIPAARRTGDQDQLVSVVKTMRSLEPLLVGTEVATAEKIGLETWE